MIVRSRRCKLRLLQFIQGATLFGERSLWRGTIRRAACLTVAHAILIQNAPAAASNAQYDVIPAPAWVLPASPPAGSSGAAQNTGSASYLLVDRQVRLDRAQSEYAHFITRINNVAGVQDESQIKIEFDPKMDKLHVHSIVLRRGPIVIDELKEGRIRILQREGELDDDIVNGNLTFDLVMSDLRVGDIVDYSYSIETHSPEWGNRFYGRYKMQWDDPVSMTRLHVIAPAESRLRFRNHGTAPPTMASNSGWQSADWTIQNGAPAQYEKATPKWIEQYQSVEYSQFDGWSEVGAFAKSLFAATSAPSAELSNIVSQIEASAPTESERALAAIQFVQEEIRYTGIEEGDAAFRPRPPNDVLRSRYGDCKDKTLLAVTMLRLLKISAAPALVSTRWRDALDTHLPSPGVFDHAVVRATIADKPYWFDVTVTGQRGTLSRFAQAHFGKALVLAAGARELESMPEDEVDDPLVVAHETMDFRGGIAAVTPLTVSTRYFLTEADSMRRKLRTEGIEALAKKYLRYYQDKYPGVTSAKPLVVSDDPNYDQVTIEEAYTLHGAFAPGKSGRLVLDLYPDTVDTDLTVPETRQRKQPLAVEHPVFSADKITIFLPSPWKIKETEKHIDTPAFEYESRIAYLDNEVTLDYRYKSLKGHIEAADVPQYRKDVKRARDDTGFNLSTDARSEKIMLEPGVPALTPRAALIKLSILLVGLLVLGRSARYLMTVRLLMTVGFRHPGARVCSAADLCRTELNTLAILDETLEAHDFRATGYISYSAPMNPFTRREFLSCFVDESGATLAIVARNPLPEYASTVRLAFETPLSTGQWLRTTSHPDAQVYSSPTRLSQLKLNLSPEELLTEHAARLDVHRVENVIDADADLNRYAEGLNSAFTIEREEYRRRGWMQPTADPDRDRFTVLGACRMGFRVVRSSRGTGKLPPRVDAWTDADRSRRIDADCVALLHNSGPLDLSQGTSFRLIGFIGSVGDCLAARHRRGVGYRFGGGRLDGHSFARSGPWPGNMVGQPEILELGVAPSARAHPCRRTGDLQFGRSKCDHDGRSAVRHAHCARRRGDLPTLAAIPHRWIDDKSHLAELLDGLADLGVRRTSHSRLFGETDNRPLLCDSVADGRGLAGRRDFLQESYLGVRRHRRSGLECSALQEHLGLASNGQDFAGIGGGGNGAANIQIHDECSVRVAACDLAPGASQAAD
jgi:hypothetical protein